MILDGATFRADGTALCSGQDVWTYGGLAERAARAAAWLRCVGLGPGARLFVFGSSHRDTLALLFACFERGVVPVLAHPRWTASECRAAAGVTAPAYGVEGPPNLDAHAAAEELSPVRVPYEQPMAILFTSGTTGAPRGVVLSKRAFIASAEASAGNLGWAPDDRWLLALPVAHIGGLSIVTRSWLAGTAVVLPPELEQDGRLTLESTIASIERDRVTLLSVVPTQLARLLDRLPRWDPPAYLRAILVGGAAASPAILGRAADRGWPVLTTYGLTEACSQVATQPPGTENRGELGSGRPLAGTEVRVRAGRIQVRGPTLLSGYLPEQPAVDAEGWFDTGDYGRLEPNGTLHVLGRGRDLIVTGGENVHPLEIEQLAERCDGVVEACAFGLPDSEWGEVVAIAVVTDPRFDMHALSSLLAAGLARFKQPRRVATVAALPVTRAGKLDREAAARAAEPLLVAMPRP